MTIQEIKSRLTIREVLQHYNLRPDANSRLTCPWHNDTTPSLQVYPKTNTWTCFSSKCTAGSGDVIDFVMKYEKLSKHEAIQKCKELLGYDPVSPKVLDRTAVLPPSDGSGSLGLSTPEGSVRQAVLSKFYRQLQYSPGKAQHASAKKYLESRKIEGVAVAYCSGRSLSDWKRRNKDWYKSIEQYGLSRFRESIVFAMRNRSNQIVGLYGRKLKDSESGNHYYLNGPHEGLYPSWPSAETKCLVLTESIIDAASLLQLEGYEVLALYGTKGFTKDHAAAIKSVANLEELILFMDGDKAGEEAIPDLLEKVQSVNDKITISKVNAPGGTDPNSLLQTVGIEELIEERQELYSSSGREKKEEFTSTKKPSPKAGRLDTSRQDLLKYEIEELLIWIMGGIKITNLDKLRVSLKVERKAKEDLPVRESLDLYHGRQVDQLVRRMSEELELNQRSGRIVLSELTNDLEVYRSEQLDILEVRKDRKPYQMTASSRQTALTYLQSPDLISNTVRDIARSGIIGEEKNALIGLLVYTSRKRDQPLHVMYLGSSGSGKTHVQEGLSHLIPEEDKEEATGMSPQSLYYEGVNLKGKVFFIEDLEGAQDVLYVIRELQTKRKITKKVAVRDNRGKTKTVKVTAEGPVVFSSCTTKERLYEDNANRCILLYIDQSKEQDKRIMDYIKSKSSGKIKKEAQEQVRKQLQDVQRMLKPIAVVNPYADYIDLPAKVFKPRRSINLLISFIETVTYYHQYQRPVKIDDQTGRRYIETTVGDIELSLELLKEVLFDKSDELSNASRIFLEKLKGEVKQGETFTRGAIRKRLRVNVNNIKRYLRELVQADYLKVRTGNRYRGFEYEIVDYGEYASLKSSVEERLKAILLKIKELSGSVGQSGPKGKKAHLRVRESVS